jgi:hypothetical protein
MIEDIRIRIKEIGLCGLYFNFFNEYFDYNIGKLKIFFE